MSIKNYGFTKKERISSKIEIDKLFSEGKGFITYPLRIIFLEISSENNNEKVDTRVSVLINVPKRKFKKATDRNHLKRLIRESYRLNKHSLTEIQILKDKRLLVVFLYLPDEKKTFSEIENAIKKAIEILKTKIG